MPGGVTDESRGGPADAEPISCWWKTDKSAVHVGEHFSLTLTCGLIESEQARAVADAARLDPAALNLTPFEIVGGTRHRDIEAAPRRYIQYSYTLRLLGDDVFGQDVDIPGVAITYNLEGSAVAGVRGRDQVYLLPSLPVRVLSLVPRDANDIRDATPDTFGDIDRRQFRASAELTTAGALFACAAVLAGLAVVRLARPKRARTVVEQSLPSNAAIVSTTVGEAERIRREKDTTGWTRELVDAALTVLRIGAAIAAEKPVAQRVVERTAAAREGQLRIRKGRLSSKRVLVSASVTPAAVASFADRAATQQADARLRVTLEELAESLAAFEAARYAPGEALDGVPLDAALETGMRALARLATLTRWPARAAQGMSRAADRVKGVVWDR